MVAAADGSVFQEDWATMGWTRTSTEVVHQGPFVALHRDSVLRPDGSVGTYEHVTVDDAVRVVALDGQGQVVLVEDDFYLQQRRVLHLPGGGCGGQDPYSAALRELEEETGLVAGDLRPLGVIDPLPSTTAARTHLFLAADLRPGTVHRDDTEAGMTLQWWKMPDAVEAVRVGRITEAGSVSALLLAERTHRP
ncbi:NUDIX domain-containing protein [Streptomyces luteogriseus]|uniref:NUDIX domain-containing protein n=1 Tax=Streptomyces luteogriseus TaxID=68233 RepID=UPI0037AA48F7